MRYLVALLFVLALMGLFLTPLAEPVAAAANSAQAYTVVFRSATLPADAADVIEAAGGRLVYALDAVGVAIAVSSDPLFADRVSGSAGVVSVGLQRYQALPAVEVLEYNDAESGPTASDDLYAAYQWDIRRVKADQAWATTTGSHDTVVAVIDTGIASNHPDLSPNLVYAACFSLASMSGTGTCSTYPDLHWHGTHVAGTVAAAFDHGRVVGVGPDLGLASYNVFELVDGDIVAFDGPIWAAMLDAADRGFDVINMSLGGYVVFPNSQEDVATWTAWNRVANYVTRQGVTIVASAGNGDLNLNGPVAHIPSDLPDVISVGATGIRPDPVYPQPGAFDVRAFYSNYGAAVTLSAPGGDLGPEGTPWPFPAAFYLVMSSYVSISPDCAATASCPVGYAWAGGTSMASPHVAGAAGLVKDADPSLTAKQVRSILKRTAENLGDRQQFGHGMLDVEAAVNR